MKEMVDKVPLPQFETLLESLERRVATTEEPAQKARIFNLAGDMCFDANQAERGLSYYDLAINVFTECEQFEAAAKICEKIVALKPDAVRPYYTLAWIAIKRGRVEEARVRIEQYVFAAEAQKLVRLARPYLVGLAETSANHEVLDSIAEGLIQLNDAKGANAVYGRMHDINAA